MTLETSEKTTAEQELIDELSREQNLLDIELDELSLTGIELRLAQKHAEDYNTPAKIAEINADSASSGVSRRFLLQGAIAAATALALPKSTLARDQTQHPESTKIEQTNVIPPEALQELSRRGYKANIPIPLSDEEVKKGAPYLIFIPQVHPYPDENHIHSAKARREIIDSQSDIAAILPQFTGKEIGTTGVIAEGFATMLTFKDLKEMDAQSKDINQILEMYNKVFASEEIQNLDSGRIEKLVSLSLRLILIAHDYLYQIYTPHTRTLTSSILETADLLEKLLHTSSVYITDKTSEDINKIFDITANIERRASKNLLISNQTLSKLLWEKKINFIYPGDDIKENKEAIADVMQLNIEMQKLKDAYLSASIEFDGSDDGKELSDILEKLDYNGLFINLDWGDPSSITKKLQSLKKKEMVKRIAGLIRQGTLTIEEYRNLIKLIIKKVQFVLNNPNAKTIAEEMRQHDWGKTIRKSAVEDRNAVLAKRAAEFHKHFPNTPRIATVYGAGHEKTLPSAVEKQNKKSGKMGLITFSKTERH